MSAEDVVRFHKPGPDSPLVQWLGWRNLTPQVVVRFHQGLPQRPEEVDMFKRLDLMGLNGMNREERR